MPSLSQAVEHLYAKARRRFDAGEHDDAARIARRVLQLDGEHAGAHNLLGLVELFEGDDDVAADHFRAAIRIAEPRLAWSGARLPWAVSSNRHYLEAHANLARWHRAELAFQTSAELLEQVLAWCPECDLDLRPSIAEDWLRAEEPTRALAAFAACGDDAGSQLSLSVALWGLDRGEDATRAMLRAIGGNRYLAVLVLNEIFETAHAGPVAAAELGDALAYARRTWDIWEIDGGATWWLAAIWFADETQAWRSRIDEALLHNDVERLRVLRDAAHIERLYEELRARHFGARSGAALIWGDCPGPGEPAVVDVRHREIPANVRVPGSLRALVAYERRIVEVGSAWGLEWRLDSTIRCRRRPGRQPCPGHLAIRTHDDSILWGCSHCSDRGVLHHWRDSGWDRSGEDSPETGLIVSVTPPVHRELLALEPPEALRPALRARYGPELYGLQGTSNELRALADAASRIGRFDLAVPLLVRVADEETSEVH